MSKRTETNGLYAKASFVSGGKTIAANHFTFCKPNYLKLYKPSIQIQPVGNTSFYITSNAFAKYTQLTIAGKQVHFSDNYFDLLPNEKKLITLDTPVDDLTKKVVVKTLAEVGRVGGEGISHDSGRALGAGAGGDGVGVRAGP